MKAVKITLTSIAALVLISVTSFAQGPGYRLPAYNKFSIELNAGLPSHFGDVKQNPYWPAANEFSFGAGLGLNYHFSPVFTLRGNFLTGKLIGQNTTNNMHFENNFSEFAVKGVLNFNQLFVPNNRNNENFSIYGVLGLGVIGYRSMLMALDTDQVLGAYGWSADGTEKGSRHWDMVIPFGMGFKFRVSERVDLGIESGFRYAKTDKLDAVNRNFSANDMYNYTSVGLTFRLGRNTNSAYWARAAEAMYQGDSRRMDLLANRFSESQENMIRIEQAMIAQAYDEDIAELRKNLAALDKKNNELAMRLHNLQSQVGSGAGTSVTALLSVYFQINSASLDGGNYERVAAAARYLQSNPNVNLRIVGHSDRTGPDRFNRILSERRAKAVHDILVNDFRIDASRLAISYIGPDDPMSEANNSINRRVDFIIEE